MKFTTWYQEPIELSVDLGPDQFKEWVDSLLAVDTENTRRHLLSAINRSCVFLRHLSDESLRSLSVQNLKTVTAYLRDQADRIERITTEESES